MPSPIMTAVRWASGARSPEAPTEPCAGTAGVTPAASIRSSTSTMAHCTPEAPRPRLSSFRHIMSRTTGSGRSGPTPALWERIRLRCSRSVCWGEIRVPASLPKPVLTPYTAASPAAARSTTAAARSTSARQLRSRTTGGLSRYSRSRTGRPVGPGVSVTGSAVTTLEPVRSWFSGVAHGSRPRRDCDRPRRGTARHPCPP